MGVYSDDTLCRLHYTGCPVVLWVISTSAPDVGALVEPPAPTDMPVRGLSRIWPGSQADCSPPILVYLHPGIPGGA